MKEFKDIISIYINDTINILDCKHKTELTFRYLKEFKEKLGGDYNINIAIMKNKEDGVSGIREVLRVKGYEDLDTGTIETNINMLLQSRLKNRSQTEAKHYLVLFSIDKDMMLINENNLSYFYNIDSLLSGSYLESLINKINIISDSTMGPVAIAGEFIANSEDDIIVRTLSSYNVGFDKTLNQNDFLYNLSRPKYINFVRNKNLDKMYAISIFGRWLDIKEKDLNTDSQFALNVVRLKTGKTIKRNIDILFPITTFHKGEHMWIMILEFESEKEIECLLNDVRSQVLITLESIK